MSTAAIVMMIVTILIIWGGLVAAAINLSRHPDHEPDQSIRDL